MRHNAYKKLLPLIWMVAIAILQMDAIVSGATSSLNLSFRITTIANINCAELLSKDQVILRIRHRDASACNAAARRLLDVLHSAMILSATDKDVSVLKSAGGYSIRVKDMEAIFVDHEIARNYLSLPDKLAQIFSDRIKRLLKQPYLISPYDELLIGIGEAYALTILGTANGRWKVNVLPHGVASASFDASTRVLRLNALKVSDGSVIVNCNDAKLTLPIWIRERAAKLLRQPVALVTEMAPSEFIREAAINALLNSVERKPGASVSFELSDSFQSNGFTANPMARLIAFDGKYLPARLNIGIQVLRIPPSTEPAGALSLSNDPERIHTEQVLSLGMLPSHGMPLRLLYHHANASNSNLWLRLELFNDSESEARLLVRFATAGPTNDEIYSGFAAVSSFLGRWFNGAAFVTEMPPRSIYALMEHPMPNGLTVTGICEISKIVGGDIGYQLIATRERVRWRMMPLTAPAAKAMSTWTRYFAEPVKVISAKHTIGGNWTFIHLGREPIRGLKGEHLHGNYGVMYHINVDVENKAALPATYELAFTPNAGPARCAAIVDSKLLQTPLLQPYQEFVLKRWHMPPSSTKRHEIYTMPLPASYYPVTLVFRSR